MTISGHSAAFLDRVWLLAQKRPRTLARRNKCMHHSVHDWAKAAISGLLVVAAGSAAYALVGVADALRGPSIVDSAPQSTVPSSTSSVATRNPFEGANGKHLIAFVIAASDCGWSTRPEVMLAVGSLRGTLANAHRDKYVQIGVVGIALDQDLTKGLGFLAKIAHDDLAGTFDQVSVGGSWLNEHIVQLVWTDSMAKPASPQVLVVERSVDTREYLSATHIGLQPDVVVANLVGSAQIVRWIQDGVPLRRDTHKALSPSSGGAQ